MEGKNWEKCKKNEKGDRRRKIEIIRKYWERKRKIESGWLETGEGKWRKKKWRM